MALDLEVREADHPVDRHRATPAGRHVGLDCKKTKDMPDSIVERIRTALVFKMSPQPTTPHSPSHTRDRTRNQKMHRALSHFP
ncbi:hypothetical protein [Azospirillum sp. B506]|uniref:hypothetical protein n=1 Tax=Azospirillum sp. B506 TaxID=137721 RepID=UPI0011DC90E4|nr:hypothetical protein [Azospirillum sp. B506]